MREDARLADNDLVWKLASPCRLDDISWIESGKAAREWSNDWGLSGVDFTAGINQPTYEYYIDFASRNGLRYLVLDDGWSRDHHSPLETAPGLDLPALVKYGEERGVGLILWLGYLPFAGQMEELCKHYSEMGVKGFKVDFMDRDDQQMVRFVYDAARTRTAQAAARPARYIQACGNPADLSQRHQFRRRARAGAGQMVARRGRSGYL